MEAVFTNLPAQELRGAIGNHFIGIHVVTGAGPGLENIHNELVVPLAGGDLTGRLADAVRGGLLKQAQLAVNLGSRLFDHADLPDEGSPRAQARDREIVDGALGLCSIQGVDGYFDFTHRIGFNAESGWLVIQDIPPEGSLILGCEPCLSTLTP